MKKPNWTKTMAQINTVILDVSSRTSDDSPQRLIDLLKEARAEAYRLHISKVTQEEASSEHSG